MPQPAPPPPARPSPHPPPAPPSVAWPLRRSSSPAYLRTCPHFWAPFAAARAHAREWAPKPTPQTTPPRASSGGPRGRGAEPPKGIDRAPPEDVERSPPKHRPATTPKGRRAEPPWGIKRAPQGIKPSPPTASSRAPEGRRRKRIGATASPKNLRFAGDLGFALGFRIFNGDRPPVPPGAKGLISPRPSSLVPSISLCQSL